MWMLSPLEHRQHFSRARGALRVDRKKAPGSGIPFFRLGLDAVLTAIVLENRCQDGKLTGVGDPTKWHVPSAYWLAKHTEFTNDFHPEIVR